MRRSSGYRKHPSWWSAAFEMVFRSSFRLFLCLTFALFSSLFPPLFLPPYPVKLPIWMRAKWLSMPQRELRLQLPIWQQCPLCSCAESKAPVFAIPLFVYSDNLSSFIAHFHSDSLGGIVTLLCFHNLAASQGSPNLKLIIYCCCLANCSIFVGILNAFRPNYQQQLLLRWID